MTAILALYAAVGLAVLLVGRTERSRWMYAAAAVPHVVALAWLGVQTGDMFDGAVVEDRVAWIDVLGLGLDLRLDGFAATMVLLVSGVGLTVIAYSASYFAGADAAERVPRQIGVLTWFAAAMLGLVLADNVFALYAFWELTSVTSFLLIGNRFERAAARAAALQALLVTGLGGLAMFAGFVLLGQAAGTYRLSGLIAEAPRGGVVPVALLLVLLGAFTKSAQFPFHGWLPAAMVAPTPISAYLHSATMVTAGVYLVARLSPAFATVGWWRPTIITTGLVTMLWGGGRAMRATDLKALLAMGTISQLGFMMAVFGWGTSQAVVAGTVLLLAHGAYKAAAFMLVGVLDKVTGGRDIRSLPRPGRDGRIVAAVTAVVAASMAGVPLLFGFIAKESAFEAIEHETGSSSWAVVALAVAVFGSALSAAYSLRFALGATGRLATTPGAAAPSPLPPGTAIVLPAAALATVSEPLVSTSARALIARHLLHRGGAEPPAHDRRARRTPLRGRQRS